MMENDGGSDMTFCHLKSNFVERHVEGNDIRINQRCDIFANNTIGVPALPGNNSFQDCSILNRNSWRVSAV